MRRIPASVCPILFPVLRQWLRTPNGFLLGLFSCRCFALIGFVLGIHHQVKRRAFNVNQMTNNILFHQGHLTCFAAGHDGRSAASGNLSRITYTNADSSTSSYLQIVEYTPSDDRCSSMDGKKAGSLRSIATRCRTQMKRTGRTG